MKQLTSLLNSPLWKIIGFIISIMIAFWVGSKINQSFHDCTITQSPTIAGSDNLTFQYDNSTTHHYSSIVTANLANPEIDILHAIAERYSCSWNKIEGSENQYQWNCRPGVLPKLINENNFDKKNALFGCY